MKQLLIPESEAAQMLLRSTKSLRKARQEGKIAYILQGREIFYTLADIESYIEQARVTHICPSTSRKTRRNQNRKTGTIIPFTVRMQKGFEIGK